MFEYFNKKTFNYEKNLFFPDGCSNDVCLM